LFSLGLAITNANMKNIKLISLSVLLGLTFLFCVYASPSNTNSISGNGYHPLPLLFWGTFILFALFYPIFKRKLSDSKKS
jgi:hypothetical protein